MTKQKRHEIYKEVLEEYKKKGNNFLCLILARVVGKFALEFTITRKNFPELYSFKPKNKRHSQAWWDVHDREIRINVLEKCIELTK